MQNDAAKELQKEFECKLGRVLTVDEKELIHWMAERQQQFDKAGMEKTLVMKAES
ncbi:hypothetical protein [Salibacterium halotolerans]|uniref:Uncharacterized protein n=1 Tax=Salibacterium halotolerans TaxID=1884432 RepID=A0A1I5R3Z4_9BACI|nr:hypothetical protein [Salibacterium halotolerans]SFP53031.1 hypothetical protein SAMN05518683_106137 [Salibacterium halotolerans]